MDPREEKHPSPPPDVPGTGADARPVEPASAAGRAAVLRHARLSEIVVEALQLPANERAAFVRTRCAGDTALERDILGLLSFAG